jgi:hypothetical protein
MFADQVRPPQQPQVFGDRRTGHRKRSGNVSGRLAAPPQHVKHGAPGGIGQRLEGGFRIPGWRICNRTVPHNA